MRSDTSGAAVDRILDSLGSHSSRRETRAVRRLSALPKDALSALIEALRRHPNSFARAAVARSFVRFRTRAEAPLLRALRDPAMPVRLAALVALDRIWRPSMGRVVIRLLGDPSPGIRHNAVVVLGRRRVRSARPHLLRILRQDPSWHVRQQAARALGTLASPGARAALVRAMGDPRRAVREAARAALRTLAQARSAVPEENGAR